jgi:hypothetical protein
VVDVLKYSGYSRARQAQLSDMTFNCQDISVSKVEMAKVQLDAAIVAYYEGRGVVAITLAGAAEEIFGAMLSRDGKENAVEKIASLPQMLQISTDPKKIIAYLNDVRNNLKHAKDKLEDNFVMTEFDAYLMIVRALGNASLIEIKDTFLMKNFRDFHKSKV